MTESFSVEQEVFSGPLGLLLDLLDKKELSISEVNLRIIADDFLRYVNSGNVHVEELADFLITASKLIYLKSKELMPYLRIEEEDEGATLEDQLQLYRLFLDAAEKLEKKYQDQERMFFLPNRRVVKSDEVQFSPPQNVMLSDMHESFQKLLKRLQPFFSLQEESIERIKSVQERLEELQSALESRKSFRFTEIVSGAKSKGEVVVSFLALLELVRRNIIRASQETSADIHIHRI